MSLWNTCLLSYVGNSPAVFNCPSFPSYFNWTTNHSPDGYMYPTNIEGNRPFCYTFNWAERAPQAQWDLEMGQGIPEQESRRPSEINAPADMIAIGDDSSCTTNNPGAGQKTGGWGQFVGVYIHEPDRSWLIGTVHNQGATWFFWTIMSNGSIGGNGLNSAMMPRNAGIMTINRMRSFGGNDELKLFQALIPIRTDNRVKVCWF